jgi:hypothetical protein
MTIVAIHQPTFLPWLGWWDKLVRSDLLVLLDDVQFPKKGGTWMNRVRLLVNGGAAWVTVPVDRAYAGVRSVRETRVDESKPWRKKLARTISSSYAKAPYFRAVVPVIDELIESPTDRLAELNETTIRRIADGLGLGASHLVRQSDLDISGTGTDLLVELCVALEGDSYLTGDGAGEYLEPEKFAAAGIALLEQRFVSPVYPQSLDQHVTGLSIIDALMSCGWHGTASLLARPR